MKLYIWKLKGAETTASNFRPSFSKVEPGTYFGIAVHAFFRKQDAMKYLKEEAGRSTHDFELVTVEIKDKYWQEQHRTKKE